MSRRVVLLALFSVVALLPSFGANNDWLPIPQEDLAMKDFAPIPGSHAVILYRKVDRNDVEGWESNYVRIKILDEQGKDNANIETDTVVNNMKISDLEARTIKPDGTIVPFTGKPIDKLVAKYKDLKVISKTFTLPDVQAGSIIEYRYKVRWDTNTLYDSVWNVQESLPTRDLDLSLKYEVGQGYSITWRIYFLPPTMQPKDEKGTVTLSVHNLPGLEKEDYMPPEREYRARVEFRYTDEDIKNKDDYWKRHSKSWTDSAEIFMDKKKAMEREVAALISPSDSSDAKLRKLYDRVQQLRNLTYERDRTEKEWSKEKLKDNNNVEDVLKHGWGWDNTITRTFAALARAAGFNATLVRVAERDRYFAHTELADWSHFDTELALVTVDGQERFFDPGVPHCPFGILAWQHTGTKGLVLDKKTFVWKDTPKPVPTDTLEKRVANLELDRDGTLTGTASVIFEGQSALRWRLNEDDSDAAERKKDVEDLFKRILPTGANIEITQTDDWATSSNQFKVTAKVTVPNFGAPTGKRLMVPLSVFTGADNHPFRHARRVAPVYLHSPYREADDITIKLPEGLGVESLPQIQPISDGVGDIVVKTEKRDNNTYAINREIVMKGYFFLPKYYDLLRSFLDKVQALGQEQAVLRASAN